MMTGKQPQSQSSTGEVSFRSPKQEIWAAYKEFKETAGKSKDSNHPPSLPTQADWQGQLLKTIRQLDSQLQEKRTELDLSETQIIQAKKELEKIYQVKIKKQTLEELEEKIADLENSWKRKQKQQEEEFNQEKLWGQKRVEKEIEEKRFLLEMKLRQLDQEIGQKEKDWEEKEKHYQKLQQEVAAIPSLVQKEVEKARQETTKYLEKEFNQEKILFTQKQQSEQQLLEQQVKNWQQRSKEQEEQIRSLVESIETAHQKIKELAVAALESQRPKEEKVALVKNA